MVKLRIVFLVSARLYNVKPYSFYSIGDTKIVNRVRKPPTYKSWCDSLLITPN